eukprot:GHVU01144547.1.p1 GENE.GHVU01144547.1~~GHVU01144547.1.p1  ORF type:complete len:310 (-),score=38.87 GHVU01144547.1:214-1143(-)
MKGFLITSVLLIAVKVNGFNLEDFLSQSSVKTVTDRMKDAGVKTPDDLKTWQTDLATLMNFDSIRGKAKIDGIVCKENTAGAPDCRKLKCAEQKACDAAWEAATKVPTETLAAVLGDRAQEFLKQAEILSSCANFASFKDLKGLKTDKKIKNIIICKDQDCRPISCQGTAECEKKWATASPIAIEKVNKSLQAQGVSSVKELDAYYAAVSGHKSVSDLPKLEDLKPATRVLSKMICKTETDCRKITCTGKTDCTKKFEEAPEVPAETVKQMIQGNEALATRSAQSSDAASRHAAGVLSVAVVIAAFNGL